MKARQALLAAAALFTMIGYQQLAAIPSAARDASLTDGNEGGDWMAYGRTYGEQHFSPLSEVNGGTVQRLGLAWSLDLPPANSVTGPIAIGGVLYTATGYSVVRAIDAATGKVLWTHDPKAAEASGKKLRQGWGIRGLSYWNGKVIVGTQDGRLVALDAKNGSEIWSALTVDKDDYRFISGPPRVFDGKVIIGHGGADSSAVRAYVTTYDADTGKQLWRFFVVPGDPSKGFEDETQAMAAKTWSGEWWKEGGGGTAWNTFTYDKETDTILLGTGNGAPWNHKIRSAGKGDNLFLCSIVALDAKTGKYKWHYQFNPGETWDYNAAMDMQLADLVIDGKMRKVVMELPKNGFFYVIDRTNGQLISAEKVTKVTWATHIDLKSGRPVEVPAARFPDDKTFSLFPGPMGAHTWLPSAYSPQSKLIYLPVAEMGVDYDEKGISAEKWQRLPDNQSGIGYNLNFTPEPYEAGSALVAWNPATQQPAWRVRTPGGWNGGILATAGNLVFQGDVTGKFSAYDARSGKRLWSYDGQAPVLAPPISYRVKGRQYITVLTGIGTSASIVAQQSPQIWDYRTQARRVLTFALDGKAQLRKTELAKLAAVDDPDYAPDPASALRGAYASGRCMACHGINLIANGTAPDLRGSPVITSAEAFNEIVRGGALVSNGMPQFAELTDLEMADLRQFIRSRARDLKESTKP